MTKQETIHFSRILRAQFIDKIESEWSDKWADKLGIAKYNFENLTNKNLFIAELIEDIKKSYAGEFNELQIEDLLISRDSLRRILIFDKSNEFQLKTRNNLAKYLGYKNWNDFVEQNKNTQISTVQKSPFYKSFWFITIFTLALIFSFIYFKRFFINNGTIEIVKNDFSNTIPASLLIKVNLQESQYTAYKIRIENENFQYASQEMEIKQEYIQIHLFTPGLKIISLLKNDKIIHQVKYLVGTNNAWYGSIRTKKTEIQSPYENNLLRCWYGPRLLNGNSSTNYLSTPFSWSEIVNNQKTKNILSFPKSSITNNPEFFTRVAFLKAQKFNLDLDNFTLNFKAKRDNTKMEDCLSFMLQMFDDNLNKLELFSSGNCVVDANITVLKGHLLYMEGKYINNFKVSKFNKIMEDFQWHDYQVSLRNNNLEIIIDNKEIFNQKIKNNFSNLREIWFIFEGNGSIRNVKLYNTIANRIVFDDLE